MNVYRLPKVLRSVARIHLELNNVRTISLVDIEDYTLVLGQVP